MGGRRKEVSVNYIIDRLAWYACQRRLILFLGTGFSRCVIGWNRPGCKVFSWVELLQSLCLALDVRDIVIPEKNADCPLVASQIAEKVGRDSLKDAVCQIVNWRPDREQVDKFKPIFEDIRPSLVVTTNYDFVVEDIVQNHAISLGPRDVIRNCPEGDIPIYHLHGSCKDPEDIVLDQEDYVRAMNPKVYRQTKLSLLLRENAVLYVGYSKSDMNVLSAIHAARHEFSDVRRDEMPHHVQLLYAPESSTAKQLDDGSYVVETERTEVLLEKLARACSNLRKKPLDYLMEKTLDDIADGKRPPEYLAKEFRLVFDTMRRRPYNEAAYQSQFLIALRRMFASDFFCATRTMFLCLGDNSMDEDVLRLFVRTLENALSNKLSRRGVEQNDLYELCRSEIAKVGTRGKNRLRKALADNEKSLLWEFLVSKK